MFWVSFVFKEVCYVRYSDKKLGLLVDTDCYFAHGREFILGFLF